MNGHLLRAPGPPFRHDRATAGRLHGDATCQRRLLGDQGITLIWVALLLVVILMFAALALDGGQAYQSGRQSQNAADSGAMAAARVLDGILFDAKTNYTSIASQAKTIGKASGADSTSGGVRCWIISFPDANGNTTRISLGSDTDGLDMCSTTYPSTTIQAWVADPRTGGVEVRTKATRKTYFAGAAGSPQTAATRPAKAFSYAFGGGTGSPFVVCGVSGSFSTDAYSILDPTDYHLLGSRATDTTNALVFTSGSKKGQHKYYTLQDPSVPNCGLESSTFKGKSDGKVMGNLPTWEGVDTGNGYVATIQLAVSGIKPCAPGQTNYDGCAMLIPIADYGGGTGASKYGAGGGVLKCDQSKTPPACDAGYGSYVHVVGWTAWMVYGDGGGGASIYGTYGNDDKGVPINDNRNPKVDGMSCANPIKASNGGGSPQYCGYLLGSAIVTGGNRGGPGVAGQPRIIGLGA